MTVRPLCGGNGPNVHQQGNDKANGCGFEQGAHLLSKTH